MKKCFFCGEGLSDTATVCPWCGRRQDQQQKSPADSREPLKVGLDYSGIKVKLDYPGVRSVIEMETDVSGIIETLEKVKNFTADIPENTETVSVVLSQDELSQWDASDEKARETFRQSQRELGRKSAEANHLPGMVESEDGTILSVCKFDKAGKWQFIDLEGFARIPGPK